MSENPKSAQEFIGSKWYPKVETLVRSFHLNESVEDTLGDILLQLTEKQYLERWDASKGSYSNWLYTFCLNICRKKYKRSHSRGGTSLEHAATISFGNREEDFETAVVYEESLAGVSENPEFSLFIEGICKELEKFPAWSQFEYQGNTYNRDALTVFKLLRREYTVSEIAVILGVSNQYVYNLIQKIRKVVEKELSK